MSKTVYAETQPDWKFLVRFVIYLGLFVGIVQAAQFQYEAVSRLTAGAVAALWGLFTLPVSSADTHVRFYDFSMEIIFECTGVHYIGIFAAGISAYSGRSLPKKIAGLLIGTALIVLLNLLRLGVLGLTGHFFPYLFEFLHLYVWHALFTFFVLLFWFFWIQAKISLSWLSGRTILITVTTAFLSFCLLWANLDHYFSFLAFIADTLFPLFNGAVPMPDSVLSEGNLLGYLSGEYVIYSKTGLYTLNMAVFIALAAAGFRSVSHRLWLKRSIIGVLLMIVHHLGLLFMDWTIEMIESDVMNSVLRWSIVLLSMIAPVLCWLSGVLIFREKQWNTKKSNKGLSTGPSRPL